MLSRVKGSFDQEEQSLWTEPHSLNQDLSELLSLNEQSLNQRGQRIIFLPR